MLPLVKQAALDYQRRHPELKISVSGGGSMTGITQAAQKGVDIGNSDVLPVNQPALVARPVAAVTFGIVVNPRAGVKNLTMRQIRDVFSGKVTNWKSVGGPDLAIALINRARSSGTRAVFVRKLMHGQQPSENALTQDASGTVAAIIEQTPGAVSYLAMNYAKARAEYAVSIDGEPANEAAVRTGKYPFWSYEYMLTNGQPSAQVADFINFVRIDDPLLARLGFIPVGSMQRSR